MQKVITVTTHTNIIDKVLQFTEKEYPELNKYLKEGYKVLQIIPVTTAAQDSYRYSLTFLLDKK